ncbi:MAG: hypothetical protein K0R84_1769 [Clostridia bacterium]|nr:hypothetical protein [Clostridia bacterium]
MRKIISLILVLLLLAGCGSQPELDTPKDLPDIEEKSTETNGSEQYSWLIQSSDSKKFTYNIPTVDKPLDITITLNLVAWKHGGNDVYGDYEGRALITFDVDYSKLSDGDVSISGNAFTDSIGDMSFEITPYDRDEYDKIRKSGSEDLSLAPLRVFSGMSAFLADFNHAKFEAAQAIDRDTGKILYNVNEGVSDEEKIPIGINFLVDGEDVTIDIPTYNSTWKLDFFRGSITQNKDGVNPIDTFRDILISRMEQRQELSENAGSGTTSSDSETGNEGSGSYMTDDQGREGFDTNGDGKLDMWMDENGDMRMDLDHDGVWDPVIEGEFSEGALDN